MSERLRVRTIERPEEAGQLGQLFRDYASGNPFMRVTSSLGEATIALRGYYFASDDQLEWGTLFFEKNPKSLEVLDTQLTNCPDVVEYKRIVAMHKDSEDESFLDIPERKALVKNLVSNLPSKTIALIVLTRDQVGGTFSYIAFPPTLADPSILLAVRESLVANRDEFTQQGAGDEILQELLQGAPLVSRELAFQYALQSINGAQRHAGDFHFPLL